jgi:uncharacterized protein with beta-barrel porin domain
VHEDLIVGAAVGYGGDRTTVGTNGTQSNATSVSATLYGSYRPFDDWFIDASIGYGVLGYDNTRWVSDDNTTVAGSRKGGYWFGSVSTGYEVTHGEIHLMPYVRADFMSGQLNGYAEQGASAELLTYDTTKFGSVAGTLGLRGTYDMPMSWGVLTPTARVEYRQALDGAFQQSMFYSDLGSSLSSTLNQGAASRGSVNTSVALRGRGANGIASELEYGAQSGSGHLLSQTVRASLKVAF